MTVASGSVSAPTIGHLGSVPLVWHESDGPTNLSISFDVGWADETFAWHGVTHLAEHLVLAPLGKGSCEFNGMTQAHRTTFMMSGSADDAAEFLTGVTRGITEGVFTEYLAAERNMLAAEASRRSTSLSAFHDFRRWGSTGLGLARWDEIGVDWLGEEHVRYWLDQRFVGAAAVVHGSGPFPGGLDIALPTGPRLGHRPAVVRPVLPSVGSAAVDNVTFSAVVPRDAMTSLGAAVLSDRLLTDLRYRRNITYGVDIGFAPIDNESLRMYVAVDCVPGKEKEVAAGALEVVGELTRAAVADAEFEKAYATQHGDENDVDREIAGIVTSTLAGVPHVTVAQKYESARGRGPAGLRSWMASMAATTLWMTPLDAEFSQLPSSTLPEPPITAGRKYLPPRGHLQRQYVVVGDDAIGCVDELGAEGDRVITVPWDDCATVIALADGTREVFGNDGTAMSLDPPSFAEGRELMADIDRRTPPAARATTPRVNENLPSAPPTVVVDGISKGALIALGVATLAFALLAFAGAFADGLSLPALVVALALTALGAWPLLVIRQRRVRAERAPVPVKRKQYRGMETWSDRFVPLGIAGGVALVVVGVLAHAVIAIVPGLVVVVGAVRELRHRAARK